MTAVEPETHEQHPERAERPVLRREFAASLTPGDGRTIDVRIVPYGERIVHDDGFGGVPRGVAYREEWVPGAFADQARALGREKEVLVNFEHQDGLQGVIGHGVALREESDGFYGSFRLHETADGEKALMLVREDVLRTVSLEAKPKKSVRTADGVVQRVKAHLVNIALTRFGAYEGAVVLALREEAEVLMDEELLPIQPNPEMIERCRRLGIRLPQRYQAHPDATGTPADAGTPEDGTRPETATTSSSEEIET